MANLTFEIPDEELERVCNAFCGMAGHSPCRDPQCLPGQVTKIVAHRVTQYEKVVAQRNAVANLPPLNIVPKATP